MVIRLVKINPEQCFPLSMIQPYKVHFLELGVGYWVIRGSMNAPNSAGLDSENSVN